MKKTSCALILYYISIKTVSCRIEKIDKKGEEIIWFLFSLMSDVAEMLGSPFLLDSTLSGYSDMYMS